MLNGDPWHDSPYIHVSIIVDSRVKGLKPQAIDSETSTDLECELISELVVDDLLGRICLDDKFGRLLVIVLSWEVKELRRLVRLQHMEIVGSGCDDFDGHCGSCVLRAQLVGLGDGICEVPESCRCGHT